MAAAAVMVAFNLAVLGGDLALIRRSPVTPVAGAAQRAAPVVETAAAEEDRLLSELAGDIRWGYWFQYPDFLASGQPEVMGLRYHRLLAAAVWTRRGLPAEAVVVARKPALVAYLSGHWTMQYPPYPAAEAFLAALDRGGATHLLVDEASPEVRAGLQAVMRERPERFSVVFRIGQTWVLKLEGSGSGPAGK